MELEVPDSNNTFFVVRVAHVAKMSFSFDEAFLGCIWVVAEEEVGRRPHQWREGPLVAAPLLGCHTIGVCMKELRYFSQWDVCGRSEDLRLRTCRRRRGGGFRARFFKRAPGACSPRGPAAVSLCRRQVPRAPRPSSSDSCGARSLLSWLIWSPSW